jgi:hypothetical protein
VERQNLTMRMGMRRFTRLTNGFSKKVGNLAHAVTLHYMHYNFCRVHQSLTITREDGRRIKRPLRWLPGVADHPWSIYELVGLLESRLGQTDPLPTGPAPDLATGQEAPDAPDDALNRGGGDCRWQRARAG